MNTPTQPFHCQYTSQIPALLEKLQCTIALSTYQASKLIFLSANQGSLIQLPRQFERVMGIAENPENDKLALACKDKVIVFSNSKDLALHYPKSPRKYDALYMPRMTFHTGPMDIHDLSFGQDGRLYAVNTLFSCIVTLDDDYNFTPYWFPPQIDKLVSEDRCHLNGMAMLHGKPKYATAFNQGNKYHSWRENITKTGVVYDLETNRVVAEGLAMPHSPRIFNGDLYVLLSATGELVKINTETGEKKVVVTIDGFIRGMSLHNEYLFIGVSKLRESSATFAKLDALKKENKPGVTIVHLPTKNIVGKIEYLNSLEEIYDVHILANKQRPNILNANTEVHTKGLMTPEATFWEGNNPNKQ